jgi:hypothetical protein
MNIDPLSILTKEDMEKERTPEQLSLWWEKKNQEFASFPEGHHYALLKRGLAGKFYDEILPLNLLANILYKGRSGIFCIPNLSNDNFDAIIRDYSFDPPYDLKVEFTKAMDKTAGHEERLRMKYFIEHRHVFLTGPIKFSGTERSGHKIEVKPVPVSRTLSMEKVFSLILDRIEAKCKKKYGYDHLLVILIDDYLAPRFGRVNDQKELKEFLENNVFNLNLDLRGLCILGLSGKTFFYKEYVM